METETLNKFVMPVELIVGRGDQSGNKKTKVTQYTFFVVVGLHLVINMLLLSLSRLQRSLPIISLFMIISGKRRYSRLTEPEQITKKKKNVLRYSLFYQCRSSLSV